MSQKFNKLRERQQRYSLLHGELKAMSAAKNPDGIRAAEIAKEMADLQDQIDESLEEYRSEYGHYPEQRVSAPAPVGSPAGESASAIAYMRSGDGAELKAMTSGVTGGGDTGGYLIPQSWENQIIERERELFVMRQLAEVQTSETDRNIPIADDLGESQWIKEGAAYPESDAAFSGKVMKAYKVGRICKVSEELLMDNAFNLENWLINTFSYTNGLAMEKAYFTGSGEDEPRGFMVDAETLEASGATLSYGDILDMFAALRGAYHFNAKWLMNMNTLAAIMRLKDDSGAFIYKPFEQKSKNDPLGHILGKPVVISSLMPNTGKGAKPVAFGDFRRYRIHDRAGFSIQRLSELFATNGFIGFRGMQRTDGKLLIPEAIKVLEFSA